jgi:hypothetical protein
MGSVRLDDLFHAKHVLKNATPSDRPTCLDLYDKHPAHGALNRSKRYFAETRRQQIIRGANAVGDGRQTCDDQSL